MRVNPHPQDCPALTFIFNSIKSVEKIVSTNRNLKAEKCVHFNLNTYVWKNCQWLPIILFVEVPPPALAFKPCSSSHIFVWCSRACEKTGVGRYDHSGSWNEGQTESKAMIVIIVRYSKVDHI